jgi:hypothetical protein
MVLHMNRSNVSNILFYKIIGLLNLLIGWLIVLILYIKNLYKIKIKIELK